MGRRKKGAPLCRDQFIGDEEPDEADESEFESDNSESSDNDDSGELESESESEDSNIDEEYEEEAPKKKPKPSLPPPAPFHDKSITLRWTGSLRQFSMDPGLSSKGVDPNSPAIFEGDTDAELNPEKKSTNHQIGGITIVRWKNDFPVSLNLSTNLLPLEKQQAHDTSGNSGIFTFYPNTKASSANEQVCGQIGDSENNLLSRYPEYNLDNLESGITHIKSSPNGTKCSLIPKGHPLIELYNQKNGRNASVKPVKQLDDSIKASTQDTLALIEVIKSETRKKVQGVNLYGAGFSIQRAFVDNFSDSTDGSPWVVEEELFDNVQFDKTKHDALDQIHSLYVTLKIKYKPL